MSERLGNTTEENRSMNREGGPNKLKLGTQPSFGGFKMPAPVFRGVNRPVPIRVEAPGSAVGEPSDESVEAAWPATAESPGPLEENHFQADPAEAPAAMPHPRNGEDDPVEPEIPSYVLDAPWPEPEDHGVTPEPDNHPAFAPIQAPAEDHGFYVPGPAPDVGMPLGAIDDPAHASGPEVRTDDLEVAPPPSGSTDDPFSYRGEVYQTRHGSPDPEVGAEGGSVDVTPAEGIHADISDWGGAPELQVDADRLIGRPAPTAPRRGDIRRKLLAHGLTYGPLLAIPVVLWSFVIKPLVTSHNAAQAPQHELYSGMTAQPMGLPSLGAPALAPVDPQRQGSFSSVPQVPPAKSGPVEIPPISQLPPPATPDPSSQAATTAAAQPGTLEPATTTPPPSGATAPPVEPEDSAAVQQLGALKTEIDTLNHTIQADQQAMTDQSSKITALEAAAQQSADRNAASITLLENSVTTLQSSMAAMKAGNQPQERASYPIPAGDSGDEQVLPGYDLRGVSAHAAVVGTPNGVFTFDLGKEIPGAGTAESWRSWQGTWELVTSTGVIRPAQQ